MKCAKNTEKCLHLKEKMKERCFRGLVGFFSFWLVDIFWGDVGFFGLFF